jgi:hypothetical protein
MVEEKQIYEIDKEADVPDPDEIPIRERRLFTQPYDLVVQSLVKQIDEKLIFLRPLTDRPRFQRKYVWTDKLASRLIESMILNIPIPPCYLSQNDEYELDVIDGQQRLYSIYRFLNNQFKLTSLEVLTELNDLRFHEIPTKMGRQIKTHTLRCVLITNESHPEIKFDVFERLNTNTMPLNAQELRNCMYRGSLIEYLQGASENQLWLSIRHRVNPDKRLRDEELVLRFFAFYIHGIDSYRTPQKHWLNSVAKAGRSYSSERISDLDAVWNSMIHNTLIIFESEECFRRPESRAINRALFDLVALTLSRISPETALAIRDRFRVRYFELFENEEFMDLISRSVDHTRRTKRRFEIWEQMFHNIVPK